MITISSGGSLGKEAPGVLAGAGTGALLGRILKSPERQLQVLLGCGAAGGIAAAFCAPLAGVVFVVEVIYGELETSTFIPIVISFSFRNHCLEYYFWYKTYSDIFVHASKSL